MDVLHAGLKLEKEIFSGVHGASGSRFMSVRELAQYCGCSYVTAVKTASWLRSRCVIRMEGSRQYVTAGRAGKDSELESLDFALASIAIEEAVRRHAGTIEETYTMMGLTYVQSGKNLTKVKQIVVTGGSLIHTKRTEQIAAHALYSPAQPASLRPKAAGVWVDRTYILAAMGLLSSHYPAAALRIMKKELEYHGHSE